MNQDQIRQAIVGLGMRDPRLIPELRGAYDNVAGMLPASVAARLPAPRVPLAYGGRAPRPGVAAFEPPRLPPAPGDQPPPAAGAALAPRPPALPRLLPVPPARSLRVAPADPALVADVEAALLSGGLWRVEDLRAGLDARHAAVASALSALSARGDAVHVALGHWRSRRRDACLVGHGRTSPARVLGSLLHGLSLDLAFLADRLDLHPSDAAPAPRALVSQSLAVEVAPDTWRCPDPVRGRIIERLGPAPLTDLGRRVLDALAQAGPMRKSDAATAAGIGRGSANRMIDRLLAEGWVLAQGIDRFAAA